MTASTSAPDASESLQFVHLKPENDDDAAALVEFLSTNHYPFHMRSRPSADQIRENLADGDYGYNPEHYGTEAAEDTDHRGWWVFAGDVRLGIAILEDLTDAAPLFDLRLAEEHRGKGWGVPVLRALTSLVFETYPEVDRFEGQTREDNLAMRKVFLRAGFIKEAHYRRGWPVEGAEPVASVAYGILRQDWESGTVTTFEWEDLAV
ncbi:GNAT family N-acetyltransferase [Nesterenkonia sp. MY13]|uniref:GNAT family N-acetyltransferase n=1 Tax=Nesterenkonia sedimenti TaxID=1463632 RepID=A0A7X8TLD4_9MICC|nr:GNAT family protein [Nesterenkonia sedimenti]NLS10911.1 GNAT family N-acetyltransferase [Nesterenkonia sedimenti]